MTASPAEVWAHPGDTVTVTFSASIVGSIPATLTYYNGRTIHAGDVDWNPEGDLTLNGSIYSKSITLSPYNSNYDTQLKGLNVAQVSYYYDDGGSAKSVWESNDSTCIIHVGAAPSPTGTPVPTATPVPIPTATPRPTPIPTPRPTPMPTPRPTPTATPTGGVWTPTEKEIGYHRVNDGWQADGCMTAPVDQSANCAQATPTPTYPPYPTPTASPYPTPTYTPSPTPTAPPYPTPTYPPPYPTPTYPPPPSPTPTYPPPSSPTPTYPPPPTAPPYPTPTYPPPAPQPSPTYPTPSAPNPIDPSVPPGTRPILNAPVAASSSSDNIKVVTPGAEVPCAVQTAQDFDTYTRKVNGVTTTSYVPDGPLTYKWSADKGTFKNGPEGQSVIWVAPDDVTGPTPVTIKCTIDDPDGARVSAPDTGTHDDAAVVRTCQVLVKVPVVEFSGAELVSHTVRACAGGVDDHGASDFQYRAHTRKIDLTIKFDDKPLPSAKFTLRFIGNRSHDYGDGRTKKMARLHKTDEAFDAAHPWQETLEMQADSAGKVSVWVLSSDVINRPTLQAILKLVAPPKEPIVLGEIGCDFAASETFRNFKNPVDPDDPDDFGWIFDFPKLVNPTGPTNQKPNTPAKVYLKFKIDPNKEENFGNWQFVNGHELLLRVVRVASIDFETGQVSKVEGTPEQLKGYAYFSDTLGPGGTASVTRVTKSQGETAPQPYVIAGPDLKDSFTIYVRAKDNTEHKE